MSHIKRLSMVAEIGCNHMGDFEIAKELIKAAVQSKADFVKLQKRHNRSLLPSEAWAKPHPVPKNAFGDTYGAHREALEFDLEQHRILQSYCQQLSIGYSTSVWDVRSAQEMVRLAPDMLKVPSASNLNFDLYDVLCDGFAGAIHVSLGMTTRPEIEKIVSYVEHKGRASDLTLYSCTSGYPVAPGDVCLLELGYLMRHYGTRVAGFAFSGHHLGGDIDLAVLGLARGLEAAGFGAFTHIERHFTADRSWKGTDHAASLEPSDFLRLSQRLHMLEEIFRVKSPEILPIESVQRTKLKQPHY